MSETVFEEMCFGGLDRLPPDRINGDGEIIEGSERRRLCSELAGLIAGKGNILEAAVAGSFFKNDKPKDLDLAIIVKQEALPDLLESIGRIRRGPGQVLPFVQGEFIDNVFGLKEEEKVKFLQALSALAIGRHISVDMWVFPERITPELLTGDFEQFYGHQFLESVSRNSWVFNPDSGKFEKKSLFSDESEKMIQEKINEDIAEFSNLPESERHYFELDIHDRRRKREKNRKDALRERTPRI